MVVQKATRLLIAAFFGSIIFVNKLFVFRVNATEAGVNRNRLISAMVVGTLLIAFLSYYATTVLRVIPSYPVIDVLVLFMGPASGVSAGYAASYLWNKYLRNMIV